jgi:hypothetical protein
MADQVKDRKMDWGMFKTIPLFLALIFLLLPLVAWGQSGQDEEEHIFVIKDYRYEPGMDQADPDMGLALCGTRCNALATDYLNITTPGGWRMQRVASSREVTVSLDNPFMGGNCICVVDEYLLRVNDFYMTQTDLQVGGKKKPDQPAENTDNR